MQINLHINLHISVRERWGRAWIGHWTGLGLTAAKISWGVASAGTITTSQELASVLLADTSVTQTWTLLDEPGDASTSPSCK
jgi:hypothetical protein